MGTIKKLIKSIPTSLDEITMEDLIQFIKLDLTDKRASKYKALELFCDMDKTLVDAMNYDDTEELYNTIEKAFKVKPDPVLTFELNGVKYGRIPNLDKITNGEYFDMDTFITPLYEGEIKHEDAFVFMSVMYRPIIEEVGSLYKIEPYTADYDHDIFKQAPASAYLNTVGFFLDLRMELLKNSLHSLEEGAQAMSSGGVDKNLISSTGGITLLMDSLEETYLNTLRYRKSIFSKLLIS